MFKLSYFSDSGQQRITIRSIWRKEVRKQGRDVLTPSSATVKTDLKKIYSEIIYPTNFIIIEWMKILWMIVIIENVIMSD